ncbi:DUF7455 domain-containing protein [Salininema proteolyticum]|uniref:DUF7455 domain-containing protein n=1 Tax=Salininema proteolyticum TaxID=1607685 RepID=A0ABV8U0Y6_9ACTN
MTSTLTPPKTSDRPVAGERCDRCGAAAKLRVLLAEGGDLVFCGHHANAYADKLVPIVVDFSVEPEFEWRGKDLMASEN